MIVCPQPEPMRRPSNQDVLAATYRPPRSGLERWSPPDSWPHANPDIAQSARRAAATPPESGARMLPAARPAAEPAAGIAALEHLLGSDPRPGLLSIQRITGPCTAGQPKFVRSIEGLKALY